MLKEYLRFQDLKRSLQARKNKENFHSDHRIYNICSSQPKKGHFWICYAKMMFFLFRNNFFSLVMGSWIGHFANIKSNLCEISFKIGKWKGDGGDK